MAEFYIGNHAALQNRAGGGMTLVTWQGYSFQAAYNMVITHLIGSVEASNIQEGFTRIQTVAIYRGQRVPTEVLGIADIVIKREGGDPLPTLARKQIIPILGEPVRLEAGQWYTIAQGARATYFEHVMGTVGYFDVPTLIAAEGIIDDWSPTTSFIPEQYYDWGITGFAVDILGQEPLTSLPFGDEGRPEIGFASDFNIWVAKGAAPELLPGKWMEWEVVPSLWVYKEFAWKPITGVWVRKGDEWKSI